MLTYKHLIFLYNSKNFKCYIIYKLNCKISKNLIYSIKVLDSGMLPK